MQILADHTAKAIINAPLEQIDLTQWLFTLKHHEYRLCSKAHIAAGSSVAEDGKLLSVNVEFIAGNLLVQHYVEDIALRDHCRVHSVSDSFSALGQTKLDVTWEIRAEAISAQSALFSNRVVVAATPEFLGLLESMQVTDLEPVKAQMSQNVFEHNAEETPLFAKDIERKAISGNWKPL